MRSDWDDLANLVYALPEELCERLDAAAELRLNGEPAGSMTDDEDDDECEVAGSGSGQGCEQPGSSSGAVAQPPP